MSRPDPPAAAQLRAPATQRNRDPILDVLRRVLPAGGNVLEIASGTGEHAVHFAAHLPGLVFQPSDPNPAHRASIAAWTAAERLANVRPPLALDVTGPDWDALAAIPRPLDAILCINMIHISPWDATLGLVRGAGRLLGAGGALYLYGPYRRAGRHTAPSNEAFDRSLRMQDPEWGVRDLEDVAAAAGAEGFVHVETVQMPANNLSVVFRRPSA
jgi:SAM-dependent methyltransferase